MKEKLLAMLSPEERKEYEHLKMESTYAIDGRKLQLSILETLAKLKFEALPKPECVWTFNDDNPDAQHFKTDCKRFIPDWWKDNERAMGKMIYCPYCGGKIKEAK